MQFMWVNTDTHTQLPVEFLTILLKNYLFSLNIIDIILSKLKVFSC